MVNARWRWLLLAAAAIVAIAILVPLFRAPSERPAGPSGLAGVSAPVFQLRDDTGAGVSLDRYRGRVVLMNLWATWCPPCRAEMPDLQRLYEAYRSHGLVVVGVNEGESPQRARAFASSLGIRFPIWIDERQQYGRVYAALGMPTTVIVGRDGVVVRGYDGALTFDQMREAVAGLVSAR
ncbi:MAG: TlpA family protein disulfide reductase [Candidatus Eremiobacteraeota bacterium]|nr:TlpA family protein disulfide reductase [Candidatus Eremiobacteraeota bacterium]